jgi:hypothetical protein
VILSSNILVAEVLGTWKWRLRREGEAGGSLQAGCGGSAKKGTLIAFQDETRPVLNPNIQPALMRKGTQRRVHKRGFYERLGGEHVQTRDITVGGKQFQEFGYGWKNLDALAKMAI